MVKIHFHRVSLKDRLEENKHALVRISKTLVFPNKEYSHGSIRQAEHADPVLQNLTQNSITQWALDRLAAAKGISHSPKKRNSKFLSTFSNNLMSGSRTPRAKDATLVDVPATPKGQSMEGSRPNRQYSIDSST
jgi:hypothetical protein